MQYFLKDNSEHYISQIETWGDGPYCRFMIHKNIPKNIYKCNLKNARRWRFLSKINPHLNLIFKPLKIYSYAEINSG